MLRVVPGGNESGEGRTEVQRASTVRCAMLYRVDREGELRSSGGSRTSQKRQSNTTGKLDSHRVASSRSTPRSTDTLHRTPPLAWVQVPYEPSSVLRGPRTDFSAQLHSQGGSIAFTGRLNCIHRARSANRLLDHAAAPRPTRLSHSGAAAGSRYRPRPC